MSSHIPFALDMARPVHTSSTSGHYHQSRKHTPPQSTVPLPPGRGRSASGGARSTVAHHERASSTSIARTSVSSSHLPKRPPRASEDYDRRSVTARATSSSKPEKKGLPPTPPGSSPSSPSPTRSRRAASQTQTVIPPYERCYTPPLDTAAKASLLPGTMASTQSKRTSPLQTRNRPGLGRRRTASPAPKTKKVSKFIKNIFSKKNIDQDSFERIEDRHWAED